MFEWLNIVDSVALKGMVAEVSNMTSRFIYSSLFDCSQSLLDYKILFKIKIFLVAVFSRFQHNILVPTPLSLLVELVPIGYVPQMIGDNY